MESPQSTGRPSNIDHWLRVAPWPIHHIDIHGEPFRPNPVFASLVGYTVEELNRTTMRRCIPAQTRRKLAEIVGELRHTPSTPYAELSLTYHHRDGSEIQAKAARVGPLDDPLAPSLVMLKNMAPTQSLDPSEIRSRFSHLIAHDLNNVFTVAQSYVDLARRQSPSAKLSEEYLERAARAIGRGIELGERLQIVGLDTRLPVEKCDIVGVLTTIRTFIPRLLSPGPQWSISCHDNIPPLLSHPIYLSRFLIDFCVNGHLRWPHSAELTLEIRSSPSRRPALLVRITPTSETAPALPTSFRPFLCGRGYSNHIKSDMDPLFLHGVLHLHPISIHDTDDALTALLPASEGK